MHHIAIAHVDIAKVLIIIGFICVLVWLAERRGRGR